MRSQSNFACRLANGNALITWGFINTFTWQPVISAYERYAALSLSHCWLARSFAPKGSRFADDRFGKFKMGFDAVNENVN